jgi:uncharacterized protein with PIN domain
MDPNGEVSGDLRYKTSKVSSQFRARFDVQPSAWWADEMLGRLARYLRIVGMDTAYRTGLDDEELLRCAATEHRTVITRDRGLARRADGAVLLASVAIEDQWRELHARFPQIPTEPRFERCTLCNGPLGPLSPEDTLATVSAVPARVRDSGTSLYRCASCGHVYWEGSHTASVRRRLALWTSGGPR